jgi:hypothetical protein
MINSLGVMSFLIYVLSARYGDTISASIYWATGVFCFIADRVIEKQWK